MHTNLRQITDNDYIPKSQRPTSLFNNKTSQTVFESFVEIYSATIDSLHFTEVHIPPYLYPVVKDIYERHSQPISLIHQDRTLQSQNFPFKEGSILHLVTAGKDSTAIAKREEPTHKGNNTLIHILGVNKIYPLEHYKCKLLYTKYFKDSDYYEIKVKLPKVINQPESPIKNAFIIALCIEALGYIPNQISIGGSATIADISETEVYGDHSTGFNPLLEAIKFAHNASNLSITPFLRDQVEPYEILHNNSIPFSALASCMSQERFKPNLKRNTISKWARTIDNHIYLSGYSIPHNKSIFDLTEAQLSTLSHSDIQNPDILTSDDYRCTKCFKCSEQVLICSRHLNFHYHPLMVENAERLILSWLDKSPNNNRINLWDYFNKVLLIPKERIPEKYHKYLSGLQTRPDGWVEPRKLKK